MTVIIRPRLVRLACGCETTRVAPEPACRERRCSICHQVTRIVVTPAERTRGAYRVEIAASGITPHPDPLCSSTAILRASQGKVA